LAAKDFMLAQPTSKLRNISRTKELENCSSNSAQDIIIDLEDQIKDLEDVCSTDDGARWGHRDEIVAQ
jgi:hypothetical protein